MTSKFASLSANVTEAYRMPILHPKTWLPIKDQEGKEAFVEVMSADSEVGRTFDREQAEAVSQRIFSGTLRSAPLNEESRQIARLAALTRGWYLIDMAGVPIDFPFSRDNAIAFYSDPGVAWITRQVTAASNEIANFMPRLSNA